MAADPSRRARTEFACAGAQPHGETTCEYLRGLPVRAVFVKAHADGARAFGHPSVLGAFQAAGELLGAGDWPKYQGRAALRAVYPVRVIGLLRRCIRLRHGSGRSTRWGAYSPADASREQEIVNPLLASKRCLRSKPLKKPRRAFETDTGMVEPSCFTSTCVGPFARSSYENFTEYVCNVFSSVCFRIEHRRADAFAVPCP